MAEEKKNKKQRARGFAGVVAKQLEPVNKIEAFQKKYKNGNVKVLLNANDGKYAAIVKIADGKLEVSGEKNGDKKVMKQIYKKNGCNSKLDTTTPLFLSIMTGELGIFKIFLKILSRKVKLKGIGKLLVLLDVFNILQADAKKQAAA